MPLHTYKYLKNQYFLLALLLPMISCTSISQKHSLSDISASFVAIIVDDIDQSIEWYTKKLGFEVIDRVDLEKRGLSQSNLKNGDTRLELIELSTALSIDDLLDESAKSSRVKGFFKFGLTVSKFDEWVSHLEAVKAEFHGEVVKDNSTGKRMIIIRDPDGNRIQIFER